MSRLVVVLAVTALLALPMFSGRERPAPAASAAPARAAAEEICRDHFGVHATTRRLVTCSDGALHRWDGRHVRRRVPLR